MLFLCYPKCSTCQKAKKWLDAHNIEYTEHHIAEENPTYDELKVWYKQSGLPLKKFFNASGLVYKEMQLKDKLSSMSDGGVAMLGRIIGMVCCILCAFPFFIIGYYNKNSKEPINFWSGDKKLKETVKEIQGYNNEMSKLYIRCALAFVVTGVICLIHVGVGICFILLECTLGIYVVWKIYMNILLKYS